VLVTTWGDGELMIYVDGKLMKKEIL
jgi:hypothetical protein